LIICLVTRFNRKIVIFQVNIEIGIDQLVLDHLPDDPGHFIAIHLYDWIFDLDLCHGRFSFAINGLAAPIAGLWAASKGGVMFASNIVWLCCLIMAVFISPLAHAQSSGFNAHRYLIVCEAVGSETGSDFTNLARTMIETRESQDRRLALIVLSPGGETTVFDGLDSVDDAVANLARRLASNTACHDGDAFVNLVGLDGQVKMVWRDTFPAPSEIYARIDSMPMRQQEMRRRGSQ
jgi:hypothetical protein